MAAYFELGAGTLLSAAREDQIGAMRHSLSPTKVLPGHAPQLQEQGKSGHPDQVQRGPLTSTEFVANDLPRSSIPPGSRSARLASARLRARQKQLPFAHILRHGCCAPELLVSLVHTPELAQQTAAYARQQVILS